MSGDPVPVSPVATLGLDWPEVPLHLTPQLGRNIIHLWVFDLSRLDVSLMEQVIQPAESARAQRIIDPLKRQLYLGGRMGLRLLLQRYTGLANEELEFGYGSRGKPKLLNQLDLGNITFNYTLSKDKVVYAFALDLPLGVDLETLPRSINQPAMLRKKMSQLERAAWSDMPEQHGNDAMLSCWTRKEAYGKTIGVGIRYEMREVDLFANLDQCYWQTPLSGMFATTNTEGMPQLLEGVQIGLPFEGVAALMYGVVVNDDVNQAVISPQIEAAQLITS